VWLNDREEFYLQYLADIRPPKIPQTQPMSIGSSFDARVKSFLYHALYEYYGPNDEFSFDTIFEAQVEPHNRDWALPHSKYVFDCYKKSGALADLLLQLQNAVKDARFEFTVEARVQHEINLAGVPLLGKPDLHYISAMENHVTHDWKVNGYCSKRGVSPTPGYVNLRDGYGPGDAAPSRTANRPHKDAQLVRVGDIDINVSSWLEDINEQWARQLCIYGWVLGEPIGSNFIVGIEQIVSRPSDFDDCPRLVRVASFRNRISPDFQHKLYKLITEIWRRLEEGPQAIFDDMTPAESCERCHTLDQYHKAYEGDDPKDKWFNEVTREHKGW